MSTHECREGRSCVCSISDLEPREDCPIHGGAHMLPARCAECGRYFDLLASLDRKEAAIARAETK